MDFDFSDIIDGGGEGKYISDTTFFVFMIFLLEYVSNKTFSDMIFLVDSGAEPPPSNMWRDIS